MKREIIKTSLLLCVAVIISLGIFRLTSTTEADDYSNTLKYTIWTGGLAVAIGYDAMSYIKDEGFVEFVSGGIKYTMPNGKIYKITQNY